MAGMRDFIVLFVHVIVTMARLAGPGGLRSVVAESALIRHQLLILNRGRKRAPNLRGVRGGENRSHFRRPSAEPVSQAADGGGPGQANGPGRSTYSIAVSKIRFCS